MSGRKVRAPEKTLVVVDHNIPTTDRDLADRGSREQGADRTGGQERRAISALEYYDGNDIRQGIVHIIGPEQGFTLPGTTIVCGDSHTATHGAFGALAHGIGTSEVEHVLATQTLIQKKSKNMRVTVDGKLGDGVTAKDIILAIIGEIGTAGGTGSVIEFAGEAIRALSMEGRMTVCNMAIEGGARAGLIAPDEKTYAYLKGRPKAPKGDALGRGGRYWNTLKSDEGAHFDKEVRLDAANLPPIDHLGHVARGRHHHQRHGAEARRTPTSENVRNKIQRALDYMGLKGGEKITDVEIDRAFIGSCTNGRIEDLRAAAEIAKIAISRGQKVSPHVNAMVVPGSGLVKQQAEAEGLRQDLPRGGLRMARAGLLDVPRDEPRQAGAGRALRLDVEPQFRRPSGLPRPHASRLARHGGGGGDRRQVRRRARVALSFFSSAENGKARVYRAFLFTQASQQ